MESQLAYILQSSPILAVHNTLGVEIILKQNPSFCQVGLQILIFTKETTEVSSKEQK